MKKFLAIVMMLLMTGSAFALSDAAYLKMKKNSTDFARADKRLSNVWTNLKKSLTKDVFAALQKDQRQWIASGRDDAAEAYMNEGYTRTEAYTRATNDRAKILPQIAEEIAEDLGSAPKRPSRPARKTELEPDPEPEPEPDPEPERKKTPARKPVIPDPVPEPEPETEEESLSVDDIEGEYKGNNAFFTVKVLDRSTQEVEISVSRWKDEVSWTSRGWLEDNSVELSDSQFSRCVATVKFSQGKAAIEVSESEDWAEATSEDFVMAGNYTKD